MSKRTQWIAAIVGGAVVVTLAASALAFSFISNANAQTAAISGIYAQGANTGVFNRPGGPGFPGDRQDEQAALASALGISVQDLQSAQQKASDAAIQQAVDQGLITQEQAAAMILHGSGIPFGKGFEGRGDPGANSAIDYNALLAEALGISTDQLQAARQEAQTEILAQAVANGTLTQEQADLIQAREALQSYIDPNTLFAQALGITTDQLQAYRDQGMTLSQILGEVGKTALEVRDAEQAAYQAALQKAVGDGVITQAQADQIQSEGFRGLAGFGIGPEHGGRGGPGRGRFGPMDGGWNGAPRGAPNGVPNGGAQNGGSNTTPNTTPSATPSSGL